MSYILKSPILGFENIQEINFEKIDDLFAKISNKSQQFEIFLVNPYALREYSFDIPKHIELLLSLDKNSKVEVYCVMVLQKNLEESLVNFLAPIIFNHDNKTAGQVALSLLDYPNFSFKAPLATFIAKSA
ncbi:flagellar biosynthesis protein FliW [Helicobacter anseris]|uniref:Flagellar biosynthesis protein FliW n=1 Tax=Helicobacter anseris TaxID=375926 RepID=A0A3D8J438_9HELI|nr:flagellar assembly protein FliW [Helicobacter anseris]RDU71996.1 flagellar biosynthesis protein FliW [Helicobacter anseris]